jgi:heme/copper-type cytochrome/quinol oxidase subunit 2
MGFTAHNFYLKLLLKQSGLVSTKSVSALRIHQLKNNFHSNRNRIAEFLTYNLKQSTRYAFTEMEYLYVENLYKEFSLRYLDERELFLKNALMFNHVTGSNFFDIEGLAVKDIASYGMYLKEDHDLKLFEQGRSSTTESFTPVIEDILLYQTGSNCFNGISLEETVVTEKFNNFIKEEQNHLVIAFQPLEQFTSSVQSNILNGNSSVFESYEEYLTSQLIGSCGFLYQLIDYVRERPTVFESRLVPLEELEIGMFRLLETDRRVVMPILRTIRYTITSQDVLHSFALPSAATKMDACPGRLNEVSLFVKRSGVMYGQCSEICGVGHGFMPIAVRNVDSEIFSSWLLFNNYKGRLMVHGIGLATRKRLQLMFGM